MRTHIIIPIGIVVCALTALLAVAWQTVTPPPITASNVMFVPPASTSAEMVTDITQPKTIEQHDSAGVVNIPAPSVIPVLTGAIPGSTTSSSATSASNCRIDGCSGQLCVDGSSPVRVTTCEYKEEYGCYKLPGVRCERQANGVCGWTTTAEFSICMSPSANLQLQ